MARVPGSFSRAYNNEVTIPSPIDARTLVESYIDLTTRSNWYTSDGRCIAFNGLIVSVMCTEDATYNGIYFLFDKDCGYFDDPNVEKADNWHKIGENSDIDTIAESIKKIVEESLPGFESRIKDLEDRATETFVSKDVFPTTGVENKLYVALDKEETYVWSDDKYICVGASTKSYSVISGGSAANYVY